MNSVSKIDQSTVITGESALSWGAQLAGIEFMAAVASLPGNEFITSLNETGNIRGDNLAFYSNGKSAADAAVGAFLSGKKAAVSIRGCDFGQIIDTLASVPLTNWNGGLLIFCVDDPGSWYTHNETDCRVLAASVRIPVVEASHIESAFSLPVVAMRWSILYRLPFVIRYTSSFSQETHEQFDVDVIRMDIEMEQHRWDQPMILQPKDVLEKRVVWEHKLERLAREFSQSDKNKVTGEGERGIICSGFMNQKIKDVLGAEVQSIKLLALETILPLPEETIVQFVQGLNHLLVLEEGEPCVEKELAALLYQQKIELKLAGKLDHTVNRAGEIFRWQLEEILTQWYPDFKSDVFFFPFQEQKDMFLPEGFCKGCSYDPVFDLLDQMDMLPDLNKKPIIVANPGCVLRSLLRTNKTIQVSLTPGSSIGVAAAISRQKTGSLLIALIGDTAFYHSGINSVIDAVYHRSNLLVIIFDNSTAAQSGFQPNPGSGVNVKNRKTQAVPIEDLLLGLPLSVYTISPDEPQRLGEIFSQLVQEKGVRVLHVKKKCMMT